MMTTTINMTFGSVVLGLLLFVIPIYTLYLLQVDVWRKALKAVGRMVVALGAAALLTQAALWLSNIAFTLLCAIIMVAVTAAAMVARSRIRHPRFVVPVALGLLLTALLRVPGAGGRHPARCPLLSAHHGAGGRSRVRR